MNMPRPEIARSRLPLLAAAASAAQAQELKIGFVNSDRVLREAKPAKAAQAKLEAEFRKREKDLNDLGNRAQGRRRQVRARTRRRCPRPSARGASASWSTRTATSSASAASSRKT